MRVYNKLTTKIYFSGMDIRIIKEYHGQNKIKNVVSEYKRLENLIKEWIEIIRIFFTK